MDTAAYPERFGLKYRQWSRSDPTEDYSQLPNKILLNQSLSVLVIYSYLRCCENRKTYRC